MCLFVVLLALMIIVAGKAKRKREKVTKAFHTLWKLSCGNSEANIVLTDPAAMFIQKYNFLPILKSADA